MQKITMSARDEVINKQRYRYSKATKKEKSLILNTVCQSTGLSRDRAARLLRATSSRKDMSKKGRSGRKTKYGSDIVILLTRIWHIMDNISSKRLAAGMPIVLDALMRHGEMKISEEDHQRLCQMSPATIDRLLKAERQRFNFKGKSTTKPGTLLRKDIPIRTGTDWNENTPGFCEVDLVAHCGESTAGEYVNTLDVTDIYTGWTEAAASKNKAQRHVFAALLEIRERLPFALKGIDSDNGAEFINAELYRYCLKEHIVFTRSRPYRKNDNCHVEQKNWSLVRRNIGYARYEGQEATDLLNRYYQLLGLYSNYFLPSMKLQEKTRDGATVKKVYDAAKTPFQRLLDSGTLTDEKAAQMKAFFLTLNPVQLKRVMIELLTELQTHEIKSSLQQTSSRGGWQ